jgi:hypothetical protein
MLRLCTLVGVMSMRKTQLNRVSCRIMYMFLYESPNHILGRKIKISYEVKCPDQILVTVSYKISSLNQHWILYVIIVIVIHIDHFITRITSQQLAVWWLCFRNWTKNARTRNCDCLVFIVYSFSSGSILPMASLRTFVLILHSWLRLIYL